MDNKAIEFKFRWGMKLLLGATLCLFVFVFVCMLGKAGSYGEVQARGMIGFISLIGCIGFVVWGISILSESYGERLKLLEEEDALSRKSYDMWLADRDAEIENLREEHRNAS